MKEDFVTEVPLFPLFLFTQCTSQRASRECRLCKNEIIQHLKGGTRFLHHLYQHHHHYRCLRSNYQQLLQT